MRIDRFEFLELTLLLSMAPLASCDRPANGPGAKGSSATVIEIPLQPPPVASSSAVSAASASSTPRVVPDDGTCSNARGDLAAACGRVGPACEGLADECHGLDDSFRPRVAEKMADCMAHAKAPRCRDKSLAACFRSAIESACVEPFAESMCQSFMSKCAAAKKPAKYTLAQCTKVLSALSGGPGSTAWANGNVELLGPSAESGSCSFDYVVPYQPWGKGWR